MTMFEKDTSGPALEQDVSLLSWLRAVAEENVSGALGPAKVPVAWLGRTSTEDAQDPTLSLPRQLDHSRQALPEEFVIVAHFFDVESGRTSAELRGRGHSHERFDIPIPRDGGIADLLAEAKRPDRRFVAVVCESIERVSRITYFGTKIEYELEQAGVALFAADEGIDPAAVPALAEGRAPTKRATSTLTRRVKQAIAEWYVLNMLELAWGGFKAHTNQGYNIGKPPYGYLAKSLRHPVEAKAQQGKVKHKLVPDPVRRPVVTQIFRWRALERLSYQKIADRLNADLDRHPPPDPILGKRRRRIGEWTLGSVREVLNNPKHTGYMVWNRRKNPRTKRGISGHVNPPAQWVWSQHPTHEPLVTRDLFEAASAIGRFRQGSRPEPGTNRHPQATRTYLLRSYIFCAQCGRRMFGMANRHYTYYRCEVNAGNHGHQAWFADHPRNILVSEDKVVESVARFFTERVLAASRKMLLDADESVTAPDTEQEARRVGLRAEITEIERRQANLVRELESYQPSGDDEIDSAWRRTIQRRFTTLVEDRRTKSRRLSELAQPQDRATPGDADLLDALPTSAINVTRLPEERQREIYDAFHLEVRYHAPRNDVTLRITIDGEVAGALTDMINRAATPSSGHEIATGAAALGPIPHVAQARQTVCDVLSAPGRIRTCAHGSGVSG